MNSSSAEHCSIRGIGDPPGSNDLYLQTANVISGLRNYGYSVTVRPVAGLEREYLTALRAALEKVEGTAEWARKQYGYRGMSKRLTACVRSSLPEPGWGITVLPSSGTRGEQR